MSAADDPPGDAHVLPSDTSIVAVTTCRTASRQGYRSVTFYLDNGTNFTCGSIVPQAASGCNTFGSPKQPIWVTIKSLKTQAADNNGNGIGVAAKWWEAGSEWQTAYWNSDVPNRYWGPAFVERPPVTDSLGLGKWVTYTWVPPKWYGSKAIDYYRSWSEYRKQFSKCKKRRCGSIPDYYYSQVFPLAAFKSTCDNAGHVDTLYNW
eukprot:gene6343-6577_t